MGARLLIRLGGLAILALVAGCKRPESPSPTPEKFGAAVAPSFPATWSTPAWYVDDGLSLSCTSDNNTGTSATCGATGVGPLAHKYDIAQRWGTWKPTLTSNVTITYLSADPDSTDPGMFEPNFNGGSLTEIAVLPASSFTGTLGTVTSKNRTNNQALQTTFNTTSGAIAAQMLLVDSTHSSRAWVQRSAGGSTWQISQPFVPYVPSSFGYFPTEVDTWASGDTITGYVPLSINLRTIGGRVLAFNASTVVAGHFVNNLTIGAGPSTFDPINIDQNGYPRIIESNLQGFTTIFGGNGTEAAFTNDFIGSNPNDYDFSSSAVTIFGGVLTAGILSPTIYELWDDTIVQGNTTFNNVTIYAAGLFLDNNVTLAVASEAILLAPVYGPGIWQSNMNTYVDGNITTLLPIGSTAGHLKLVNQTTGYYMVTSGGNTSIFGGLSLTSSNIATTAGGTVTNLAGAAITNGAQP